MNENVDSNTLNKWRKLATLLASLTGKGKLHWRETPNEDEFLTSHGGVVIVFRQGVSQNTPEDLYRITLRDKEGKVVDSFDDEILDYGQNEVNFFILLRDLMLSIRRGLSGADQALDELLEALEDEDLEIPF